MGESTGKGGGGEGAIFDPRAEPPDSSPSLPAARSERREPPRERYSRPPRSVQRRDPRADPDDDAANASWGRIDVVEVERGTGGSTSADTDRQVDSLTNAALTLRRELAKLHQQAAAVERTIEDQRRERSDALEKIEAANQRSDDLEAKLGEADREISNVRRLHETALEDLQKVRGERDDLARAVDAAKATADELARTRQEAETLREAHDEALRAASKYEAELAEIRKREQAGAQKVTDTEAELTSLRERLAGANAEIAQFREEGTHNKSELARARQEATAATEATAKVREELEHERRATKEQGERLEKSLAATRAVEDKLEATTSELTTARAATTKVEAEVARLERDLEAARHARDVNLERAMMAERETEGVRKEVERLQRELETAVAAAARAETRAATAERNKSFVEENVRQLRDEITTAFARWRTIAPSVPPESVPPPTRAVPSHAMDGDKKTGSFPPLTAEAPPFSMSTPSTEGLAPPPLPVVNEPPALELDEDWAVPAPSSRQDAAESKTVPTSPPPPLHVEAAHRSVPPPLPNRSRPPPLPPPVRRSIPPAIYPSVPPAGASPTPPPGAPPRPDERSGIEIVSKERDDLLDKLGDPSTARAAAIELRDHPEWLRGRPPLGLLTALTEIDYDVEAPIFELARMWEREGITRALVATMREEPDAKLREHGAWLLKHLGSKAALPSLAEMVSDDREQGPVRRWLLEAIERLVASRSVGWSEIGDLVQGLIHHSDPSLRDGVIGIVAALDRSDDKRRLLVDVLRTDDDEIVLASAVHALASALPIELDPSVTERLLGHPSARVQRSVMDFIERSKRAARV